MKALTLWQPWAAAVAAGVKLIENRGWEPPNYLTVDAFAIHAGKRWDRQSAVTLEALSSPEERRRIQPWAGACGDVIAVARLQAVVTSEAEAERVAGAGQGRWFFGPFGWVLEVRPLQQPVECRGYQKLWTLPKDVEAAVRAQLEQVPA